MDLFNADKKLCDYMVWHKAEFNGMKDCEKDWRKVKFGFFVPLSNKDRTPEELLSEYFGRVAIEAVFKTGKEYPRLLSIAKWTDLTVRGEDPPRRDRHDRAADAPQEARVKHGIDLRTLRRGAVAHVLQIRNGRRGGRAAGQKGQGVLQVPKSGRAFALVAWRVFNKAFRHGLKT